MGVVKQQGQGSDEPVDANLIGDPLGCFGILLHIFDSKWTSTATVTWEGHSD